MDDFVENKSTDSRRFVEATPPPSESGDVSRPVKERLLPLEEPAAVSSSTLLLEC